MSNPTDLSPAERLAGYRARIDALDDQITELLFARSAVVREVAALKGQHWPGPCHIRPAREGQMHEAIAKRFAGTDIPPIAALSIWRQLIGASTNLESPLTCVSLAQHPHHAWLAREYFGLGVGNRSDVMLADAIDTIQRGEANILLLPDAAGSDWWRDAALFASNGLRLFATLPVSTMPLPHGEVAAMALSQLSPEPSGNDTSYVVVTTNTPIDASALPGFTVTADDRHHLLILDGYITESAAELAELRQQLGSALLSLTVLGTHPKPIVL